MAITWDGGSSTSNHAVNPGVFDHTNDSSGTVWYDNGNNVMSMTFSTPVVIPSFYYANYSGGTFNIQFQAYSGASLVFDSGSFSYNQVNGPNGGGYDWIQETALANTPITSLVITGQNYQQIDDITVNAAVPEPASLCLFGLGAVGLLTVARRRRNA